MFFFDCEQGYIADNGQNDVTDGSVENYDFNWDEETTSDNTTGGNVLNPANGVTTVNQNNMINRPIENTGGVVTSDTTTREDLPDIGVTTLNESTDEMQSKPSGSTTSNPATSNPATSNPATSNPATSNPATSNPATSNPVTSSPATSNPVNNAVSDLEGNTFNEFPGTPSGNVAIGLQTL